MIYISWGFANQQQLRKKVADGQALLQDPGTRPWPSWLAWPGTTRSGSKQSSLYRPLTTFLQDYSVIAAEREIMPRFFFVPSVRQQKFPFSFLCRWITMQWTQITVVFQHEFLAFILYFVWKIIFIFSWYFLFCIYAIGAYFIGFSMCTFLQKRHP